MKERCPQCRSTNLYASDIYSCLDCGASMHPRDVLREGRDLPCPCCEAALERSTRDACYGCSRCGGVWLDNTASNLVVRSLDPALLEVAALFESRATWAPVPSPDGIRPTRICPIALEPLLRVTVKDVDLEVCRAHGTWFDAGELLEVAERFEAERSLPEDVQHVLENAAGAYRSRGNRR